MLLYLALMAEAFMGYVLPWGNMSYWGAQVIVNLFGTIPVIGPGLVEWIRGDYGIADSTLNRFFALHVIALPFAIAFLVLMHLVALRQTGSNNPDGIEIKEKVGANGKPIDGIPSAPITPTLVGLATNSASFTWTPVGNATNYAVLRNGAQIATTTSTSFTDNGWSPSSVANYQIVANNRSGSFTNTATAPAPRNVWNVTNNLPWNGTGEGASTADPDADGFANLAEYFHGLNPRSADQASAASVHTADLSTVSMRYRVNVQATDVQSRVEQTSDLLAGSWTTNGLTSTALSGEWSGWRSVSLPVSETNAAGFLRLIISE
jgi:hypothetical protein